MSWNIGEVVSRDRGGSRDREGFLGSCGEKWKLRFPAKVMKAWKTFLKPGIQNYLLCV